MRKLSSTIIVPEKLPPKEEQIQSKSASPENLPLDNKETKEIESIIPKTASPIKSQIKNKEIKDIENTVKKTETKEIENTVKKTETKDTENTVTKIETGDSDNTVKKTEAKDTENTVKKTEIKDTENTVNKTETKQSERPDPIAELKHLARRLSASDDEPPFNFQGMLRKTNFQRESLKRTMDNIRVRRASKDKQDDNFDIVNSLVKAKEDDEVIEETKINNLDSEKVITTEIAPGVFLEGVVVDL